MGLKRLHLSSLLVYIIFPLLSPHYRIKMTKISSNPTNPNQAFYTVKLWVIGEMVFCEQQIAWRWIGAACYEGMPEIQGEFPTPNQWRPTPNFCIAVLVGEYFFRWPNIDQNWYQPNIKHEMGHWFWAICILHWTPIYSSIYL